MLQLLVFRHAKAVREQGLDDHDRPLTDRGRRNARAVGAWLAQENLVPDLALISDAKRTRQTFNLARNAFSNRMRVVSDPGLYLANEAALLVTLRGIGEGPKRILLCGHNPGLHDFTTALVGAANRDALELFRGGFPTAAVAVLDFDVPTWNDVRWRAARLVRFATPKSVADDDGDGE